MSLQRKRIPVIIDTDPGVDDIIAILLAIASPELEILAFIISFGNTDLDSSFLNILKAYQAIAGHLQRFPKDKDRFPNFCPKVKPILTKGSAGPLEGDLHSAQYFHGRDGLGGISERHPDLDLPPDTLSRAHPCLEISSRSGVDVALDFIRDMPSRTITYLVLGPLTNLALMMRQDSETIINRIGRVVSMGGALDVPGNTSPVAEFNFFADPYAVKELLISPSMHKGLPLDRFLMLPLDITTPHQLPFSVYRDVVDPLFSSTALPSIPTAEKSPLTHFTSSFLERTREIMLEFGSDAVELHDIVAVWCAIENPPFGEDDVICTGEGWHTRNRIFDIERTGEITRGMLVVDRRDDQSAYSPGANRAEVQKELEKLHYNSAIWESTALPAPVEIEKAPMISDGLRGVLCVTQTPGPKTLLRLLLKRVWGGVQ